MDWLKQNKWLAAGLAVFAAVIFIAVRPAPVPSDFATAEIKPLFVTIDEDGETRIRDVYRISAPISGRVLRLEAEAGDSVVARKTVIAMIEQTESAFLDPRAHMEAEARVKAAQAALRFAEADVARLKAEVEFAQSDFNRVYKLHKNGTLSQARLDAASRTLKTARAALKTARAQLDVRDHEVEMAKSALIAPGTERAADQADDETGEGLDEACCLKVTAPISGQVLRVMQESEGVIQAGTPLVDLGDPSDLEIVADLLSTEAVKIEPGARVLIEGWGGDYPLNGAVERIEPFGFTKISTLGVEEQRVNVIIRLTDDYVKWQRLGHGFRVEVRVVSFETDHALTVPIGALFRERGHWAVYRNVNGSAVLTAIEVGAMNDEAAIVTQGLSEGDVIVIHPGAAIEDGVRLTARGE